MCEKSFFCLTVWLAIDCLPACLLCLKLCSPKNWPALFLCQYNKTKEWMDWKIKKEKKRDYLSFGMCVYNDFILFRGQSIWHAIYDAFIFQPEISSILAREIYCISIIYFYIQTINTKLQQKNIYFILILVFYFLFIVRQLFAYSSAKITIFVSKSQIISENFFSNLYTMQIDSSVSFRLIGERPSSS